MNKTVLLFVDIEVSKKDLYDAKKAILLDLIDVTNIVVSNKVKNNETSKYFIGYLSDIDKISPLCIILAQMNGYVKYFENGGKNMSFKIEDDEVHVKYNQIWNRVKELLRVKFYSEAIYDDRYIKTKVKTFSNIINTLFSGDGIPKKRLECVCISCLSIDSVLIVDKKNYPQVYLEQCKFKMKKKESNNFIEHEVDFDSDYESDLGD